MSSPCNPCGEHHRANQQQDAYPRTARRELSLELPDVKENTTKLRAGSCAAS
jgi:hypothetical protein